MQTRHAEGSQRLEPVPFRALAIRREADGALLACGQAARSVYQRLGFADGYAYHYRCAPQAP